MAHFLSGHLNISSIQWFPLFFWGFTAILTEKEYSLKNVLLLAAGLSGIALSSQYYLYMTAVVSFIILLVYFLFLQRHRFLDPILWKQFLMSALFSLPALVVGVVPYYLVHRGAGSDRTLQDVMVFSASITDFLLPFTRQPVLGKWVWKNFPRDLWNEATLYLGIPLLALSGLGLSKRKQDGRRLLWAVFLVGFTASILLAMGTNLTWMEAAVRVDDSSWLAQVFSNEEHLIFLPGYFFYKYVPFLFGHARLDAHWRFRHAFQLRRGRFGSALARAAGERALEDLAADGGFGIGAARFFGQTQCPVRSQTA